MSGGSGRGPLSGVKVLEIAGIGPAPHACMTLADLGAEVIRIERPSAPRFLAREHDIAQRARRSLVLDLKEPAAIVTVLGLATKADVLVEAFRPGVMERLGIGPIECHARNPRLVYARMTGWGQDGPLARTAGHDLTYLAVSGVLHGLGQVPKKPQFPGNLLGDYGGGSTYLVIGILSALLETARSGSGQVVDAAIVDGVAHLSAVTLSLLADGQADEHDMRHTLNGGVPYYALYETADGRHMAVAALEPQFFVELVRLLELEDACPDQSNVAAHDQIRELFASRFRERTQAEWSRLFWGTDACVAPVISLTEAANHPHVRSRAVYVRNQGVLQPRPAPRFSRTPTALNAIAAVGQDAARDALAAWGVPCLDEPVEGGDRA